MSETREITLPKPARIGGSEVTTVTVAKPTAGQLRGVSLAELLQLRTDPLLTVLPRVVSPHPSPAEMEDMAPEAFLALSVAVLGFFEAAALPGIAPPES